MIDSPLNRDSIMEVAENALKRLCYIDEPWTAIDDDIEYLAKACINLIAELEALEHEMNRPGIQE